MASRHEEAEDVDNGEKAGLEQHHVVPGQDCTRNAKGSSL